jgi:hypothetical protein
MQFSEANHCVLSAVIHTHLYYGIELGGEGEGGKEGDEGEREGGMREERRRCDYTREERG